MHTPVKSHVQLAAWTEPCALLLHCHSVEKLCMAGQVANQLRWLWWAGSSILWPQAGSVLPSMAQKLLSMKFQLQSVDTCQPGAQGESDVTL
jgi:hypothetical protein